MIRFDTDRPPIFACKPRASGDDPIVAIAWFLCSS